MGRVYVMNRLRTCRAFSAFASAFLAASLGEPAQAQLPSATLPPCPMVHVALRGTLDTKIVKSGDVFRFATTAAAMLGDQAIPAGTPGAGLIEVMDHSKSGGRAGYLILDARFLSLANGTYVPVAFAPATNGRSFARIDAGSSDAGIIGYLPYYIGTAAGIYDYFHHGKDAAVLDGTTMPLVLGYGAELGTCSVQVVGPNSPEPSPHF
jgi:hypothetical protein